MFDTIWFGHDSLLCVPNVPRFCVPDLRRVRCTMCSGPCPAPYALDHVLQHVLCTMCHAPCAMQHVPRTMHYMHHVPCTMRHAPCAVHHVPCTMCDAPCTLHHVRCTMCSGPCAMHHIVWTMSCTMCHAPCAMYHGFTRGGQWCRGPPLYLQAASHVGRSGPRIN